MRRRDCWRGWRVDERAKRLCRSRRCAGGGPQLGIAFAGLCAFGERVMAGQPNILWIVTTQWRAQATGYSSDVNARPPWLDGLASEAVDFTQAVTPHPLGPQARAALLTGKLCPENGVSGYWDPLPTDARTVAHALGDRGYATAWFGKWHLAPRDRQASFVGEIHA